MRHILSSLTLLLLLLSAPAGAEESPAPAKPGVHPPASAAATEPTDAAAQFQRGFDLLYGKGVPRDEKQANVWLRKAADQGYTRAEVALGMSYMKGRGIEKDPAKGLEWLRKAAEKSHPKAQMEVGLAYRDGLVVEKDPVKALMWLTLAAQNGGLAPRLMAPAQARRMPVEQRKEAAQMVREWRVAHGLPEKGRIPKSDVESRFQMGDAPPPKPPEGS